MTGSPYLNTAEAAARLRISTRTIKEHARRGLIPHRKLTAGTSALLFLPAELDHWINTGCTLQTLDTPAGGRICKPTPEKQP
jgi:DNA-binding transcriptional MerR regulator